MATTNTTLGQLRAASVAELEAELSTLWRSAADDAGGPAVTRSCSLTLLVYVESEEAGRETLELIDRITAENPCRAIILVAEPATAPTGFSAQISARCHLPVGGQKEVCCEQVTLRARGEAVAGLSQVAIPLVIPGLPVYLWWHAGCFAPDQFLGGILRAANRVLVDSARFPEPENDLPRLFDEVSRHSEVVFTDLNWARLTPWRELIAEFFDSPEARPCLDQLSEVRLEYERHSPRVLAHRAQALLLTGWLASRLGWQVVPGVRLGAEAASFLFRSGDRRVRVERLPRAFEGGGKGTCVSVTLKTAGSAPATFSLARGPDGKTAYTRRDIPGRPRIQRAVRLQVFDEVELLNGEIRFATRDRVYEKALAVVAQLEAQGN